MYDKFVTEILVSLRGEKDRMAISKMLGYTYNQYFKYEAGYKKLSLKEFLDICKISKKVNIEKIFKESLMVPIDSLSADEVISKYIEVWGDLSSDQLKDNLGISASKWWRIKNGKTSIYLIDFLKLINNTSGALEKFLSNFIHNSILNTYFSKTINPADVMPLIGKNPHCAVIMNAIFHIDYLSANHSKRLEVLKNITKFSYTELDKAISDLFEKNICYMDEDGFIKPRYYKAEARNSDLLHSRKLQIYVLKELLKETECEDLVASSTRLRTALKIALVSADTKAKIIEEMRQSYRKICDMIEHENNTPYQELIFYQSSLRNND